MIVLGIDPGIAITGWGIVELLKSKGNLSLVDCGVIATPSYLTLSIRLVDIHHQLQKIIIKYKPKVIAIEELFFFRLTKNILAIAQARGVILLTVALHKIPLFEYNPTVIKLALTGSGNASKLQIQNTVKNILHLKNILKPDDVADALAIGICHINKKFHLNKEIM
ncbi:MAG: crossover junction endodeoxyribonuclease RuvC [Endomicrobium sp.]|jgi:crossover junction endodeoxyribonuclease RuvC|nr:crossover junction endodeoxyribonuclease RuvC [Endomicrobium sp.]